MTDVYYYYCDAAEEMNKNWDNYTEEAMYPNVWRYFVNKQTNYYICLDNLGDFIFYDDYNVLNNFSKYCEKIQW